VIHECEGMVLRLVEAIDEGEQAAAVDELFVPRAACRVERLFAEFRSAFPDWQAEVVRSLSEGDAPWPAASGARGRARAGPYERGPHAEAHDAGGGGVPPAGREGERLVGFSGAARRPRRDAAELGLLPSRSGRIARPRGAPLACSIYNAEDGIGAARDEGT